MTRFQGLNEQEMPTAAQTAICSFEKVQTVGAVLGVALELVLDVRGWAVFGAALEQLDWSVATLAAKLSVVVFQRDVDGLHLPERFIATGRANAAALYFTLVKSFPFTTAIMDLVCIVPLVEPLSWYFSLSCGKTAMPKVMQGIKSLFDGMLASALVLGRRWPF